MLLRTVHRAAVVLPASGPGDTWVIIGTDDRAAVPEGADPMAFGTLDDVSGPRADVVLVVHRTATGARAISIPRDVLVVDGEERLSRLAIALEQGGLQSVVDGLCRSLSIPVDHVVQVDFRGFAAAVDAVGGIDLELPEPIRDLQTGLDLSEAGPAHLGGVEALSYVRSRHAERLLDGVWQPEPDGAVGRATRILEVLTAMRSAGRRHRSDPLALRRIGLGIAPHLTLDRHTGLVDLARLASSSPRVEVLPTAPIGTVLSRGITEETRTALAAAGFGQPCAPRR